MAEKSCFRIKVFSGGGGGVPGIFRLKREFSNSTPFCAPALCHPLGLFPGLPHKQKIGVNKFWVKKRELISDWRGMPTILGMNFGSEFLGGRGLKPGEKGPKFCRKSSLEKFSEKFAGKFPKIRRAKFKNSP